MRGMGAAALAGQIDCAPYRRGPLLRYSLLICFSLSVVLQ